MVVSGRKDCEALLSLYELFSFFKMDTFKITAFLEI